MEQNSSTGSNDHEEVYTKTEPGRGYVIVIYGLYIGSIMAVVTAPLGALIAHIRMGRGAPWLDTHLRFQLGTFYLGISAAIVAFLVWHIAGKMGLSSVYAWSFGYLFFTAALAWMMARCAVGIYRLTSNRPIDSPKSVLFGLRKQP